MTADSAVPKPPKGLSRRSGALWRELLTAWELSEGEQTVLENGLRLLDRADEAAETLKADGMTTVDRYGGVKSHPMVDAEVRCRRSFNDVIRQLGIRFVEEPSAKRGPGKYTAGLRST
ncbi:MAG TPA: hypothetical protein VGA13_08485 [Acidimicrobiales bacterium]